MKGSGSGGGKVFGRFSEPAHRVLDLAREEADRCGHRRIAAHVGLPEGYQGAAGLLLAALGVDLDRLQEAVAAELGGIRR
jgi:hypothetical protein